MIAGEKVVAIIQARMGSSRLPGKVLLDLAGRRVIEWVYERACRIDGVSQGLVATTVEAKDDKLVAFLETQSIPYFRGSENDVLDRYVSAGRDAEADVVVRITADCPLLDPRQSSRVVAAFLADPTLDYANNIAPPCLPVGLDTEVVRLATLQRIAETIPDRRAREHVTLHLREHPTDFRVLELGGTVDYRHHRWTLDHPEDYKLLSAIAEHLVERHQFGHLEEVLAILEDHPDLQHINAQHEPRPTPPEPAS